MVMSLQGPTPIFRRRISTSLICWDLSLLLLWHDNFLMFNSGIIFGVQMWLDNTVPCDQHVWVFKQKLFCNPFSNLTSRMKSLINFAKRHNTQTSTGYALSFNYLLHVLSCILATIKIIQPRKLVFVDE